MKRTVLAFAFILALFFSVAAGIQMVHFSSASYWPDPGPDLPRIYIRSDGSVEPATAPIHRTGNVYRLTDDIILYTIEIQCDNIILDGAGHTIQGNATRIKGYDDGNNGVIIAGQNNVTITGIKFEQGEAGIRIPNSTNITVIDNSFSNGIRMGVVIHDSMSVLIEANNFTDLQTDLDAPAIMLNGAENTVRNNFLTGSSYGIRVEGSNNVISINRLELILPIILDRADSNIIVNNTITGLASSRYSPDQNYGGNEGIGLFISSNNIISGNNITGFVNQAIRTVFSCSNNTICGNYMANNGFAVTLQEGAANNILYGNTFAEDSCKVHTRDGVITFWDNGTVGNYWGDYNGTDSNGDGVGDTPHIIIAFKWDQNVDGFVSFVSGQDNYPLVKPFTNPEYDGQKETEPFPTTLVIGSAVAVVAVVGLGFLVYFKKRKH